MNSELRSGAEDVDRFHEFVSVAMRYISTSAGWICLGAALLAPGVARAATPTPISSCQTISTPGFYALSGSITGPLDPTTGDCIVVSASDVTLNLNSFNITGNGTAGKPGTGAGIHVLATLPRPTGCPSTSTRLICKPKPLTNVFIEGNGANVNNFAYGIEDEGRRVTGDDLSFAGETNGIFLNGAHSANFVNFVADGETVGVHVVGGGNNTLTFFDASSNTQYGVWIQGSNHNMVNLFTADNNGFGSMTSAGVYIGCSATNPADSSCTDSSKNNIIFDDGSIGGNGYGIAFGAGASANQSAFNVASGNTSDDFFDLNPSCGSDLWFDDFFGSSNQSCIQ